MTFPNLPDLAEASKYIHECLLIGVFTFLRHKNKLSSKLLNIPHIEILIGQFLPQSNKTLEIVKVRMLDLNQLTFVGRS